MKKTFLYSTLGLSIVAFVLNTAVATPSKISHHTKMEAYIY